MEKIYRVDSYNESIENGIALDLGLKILAGGTSSLLYDKLVNEKKIFSMIGGFTKGLTRDKGYVYFYAIPNDKISIKKIEKLINDQLTFSIENDLSQARLDVEKEEIFF